MRLQERIGGYGRLRPNDNRAVTPSFRLLDLRRTAAGGRRRTKPSPARSAEVPRVTPDLSGPLSRRGGPLRSAGLCAGAAAGVAVMLISFRAAGRVDPYWATAVEHASTAVCAVLIQLAAGRRPSRRPRRPPRERLPRPAQMPGLALVALAGVVGDLAYASASQHGTLSVVSAVSSLYPVATIALGVAVQGQRPSRVQFAGITLALIGAAVLGAATG